MSTKKYPRPHSLPRQLDRDVKIVPYTFQPKSEEQIIRYKASKHQPERERDQYNKTQNYPMSPKTHNAAKTPTDHIKTHTVAAKTPTDQCYRNYNSDNNVQYSTNNVLRYPEKKTQQQKTLTHSNTVDCVVYPGKLAIEAVVLPQGREPGVNGKVRAQVRSLEDTHISLDKPRRSNREFFEYNNGR